MQTDNSPQAPDQTTQPTFGQQRVRVDFNPSKFPAVDKVKLDTAAIMDFINACKNDEVSKTYGESEATKQETSGEKLRLIAIAQTKYEEACMWAVKALTA